MVAVHNKKRRRRQSKPRAGQVQQALATSQQLREGDKDMEEEVSPSQGMKELLPFAFACYPPFPGVLDVTSPEVKHK